MSDIPNIEAFLLADLTLIDQVTGRISLINLIDQLRAQKVPGVISRISAVARFRANVGDRWASDVRLVAPDGKVLATVTTESVLATPLHYVISNIAFARVEAYGTYTFELRLAHDLISAANSAPVARTSLELIEGMPLGYSPRA